MSYLIIPRYVPGLLVVNLVGAFLPRRCPNGCRSFVVFAQGGGDIVRNYVTTRAESKVVVAHYSLVYTAIGQSQLPAKLVKGLGRYEIPVMLPARLAVDPGGQGRGLGKALLKDAVLRTIQAADIAGLKLLLVHSMDESAADSYRKHGFEPVLDDPSKLFLPVPLSSG
jgi:GNAT superfamily N-acetyltransferase